MITFTTTRPKSSSEANASCTESPRGTFYGINAFTGQAVTGLLNRAVPGLNQLSLGYGTETADQRVTSVADASGYKPAADCTGSTCNRGACQCSKGQVAVRLLGNKSSDSCGCTSVNNLRIQWREISGMRTK